MKKTFKLLALCLLFVLCFALSACEQSYYVTFDFQTGKDAPVTVKFDDNFAIPKIVSNGDKVFDGWYTDKACSEGKRWRAPNILTENVTVYAKWSDPEPEPAPTPTPTPTPTPDPEPAFESFGMRVIDVYISDWNVKEDGIYNTMEEVGIYIYLFHKLPSNYKSDNSYKNYTAANKLSYTGGTFQNREGLLPKASGRTFVELDIGYTGGGRNSLRIVYSSDWHIFYTSDHYKSFSVLHIHQSR